jgi:hypothetical protein
VVAGNSNIFTVYNNSFMVVFVAHHWGSPAWIDRISGNGGRLLLEGAGGCDPDACEVKHPRKALVVVVVVQHVNACLLRRGCDQRVCEGNSVLPWSIGGEVSQRSDCGSLRGGRDWYVAQKSLLRLNGRKLLRVARRVQQLERHDRASRDLPAT